MKRGLRLDAPLTAGSARSFLFQLRSLGLLALFIATMSAASIAEGQRSFDEREELSLGTLLAAALDRPGLSAREIAQAKRQARRSGALPRISVRTRRIWDDARRAEELAQGPRTRVDIDDSLLLEAQLHFDLGRLVYGADSIAWAREAREREHRRALRSREIVQLYYERERLRFEMSTLHTPDREYELRIIEIEALLDALTGGALSSSRSIGRQPPLRPEAGARGIHPRHPEGARGRTGSSVASIELGDPKRSEEGIEERRAAREKEAMRQDAEKREERGGEEQRPGDELDGVRDLDKEVDRAER